MTDVYKMHVSYTKFGELMSELVKKIKEMDKKITCVYAPPRGGLPIAVHLSHELDIPLILDLNFQLYAGDSKLLIVDDVCDSGKTLSNLTKDLICERNIDIVATATLHKIPRAEFNPDIIIETVPNECWIIYPWECRDDEPDKSYMDSGE